MGFRKIASYAVGVRSYPSSTPLRSDRRQRQVLENLELPRNGWESKLLLQCRRHLVVEPKRGQAVLFYNQHPDGRKDLVSHVIRPRYRKVQSRQYFFSSLSLTPKFVFASEYEQYVVARSSFRFCCSVEPPPPSHLKPFDPSPPKLLSTGSQSGLPLWFHPVRARFKKKKKKRMLASAFFISFGASPASADDRSTLCVSWRAPAELASAFPNPLLAPTQHLGPRGSSIPATHLLQSIQPSSAIKSLTPATPMPTANPDAVERARRLPRDRGAEVGGQPVGVERSQVRPLQRRPRDREDGGRRPRKVEGGQGDRGRPHFPGERGRSEGGRKSCCGLVPPLGSRSHLYIPYVSRSISIALRC